MNDKPSAGYGKPPIKHQFKKGASGNPGGRPRSRPRHTHKEPLDLQKSLVAELKSSITITEAGYTKKITKSQALAKSLVARALQGDKTATRLLLALAQELPKDGEGV